MNILILGAGSYKGPLTFRVVDLGRRLANNGHTVTLIVPSTDKYNDFNAEKNPQVPGVEIVQPWQFKTKSAMFNLLPYLFTSFVAMMRHRRADVIYLYKPTPITICGLLLKLLFRTPVVLDLDDLGSEVMEAQGQSKLQVQLVRWCEKLALRYADACAVTSTFFQEDIRAHYPNKPVIVISNGVDVAEYPPFKPAKPRRALYYFGVINRLSLVETVLRALPAVLAQAPETHLYMLGGGKALDDAKALARELGVEKSVTFTGWVRMFDAAKYAEFGDVALCVQPDIRTVRAASNMKVFQYMAMGMVPVVSDVGDLRSYVHNGEAGVAVPADDAKALAAACIELLQNDAERTRLAMAARKLAETQYAWQTLADKLDVFLQAQIARKKGKRA